MGNYPPNHEVGNEEPPIDITSKSEDSIPETWSETIKALAIRNEKRYAEAEKEYTEINPLLADLVRSRSKATEGEINQEIILKVLKL
mgnify:FL=1